MESAELIYLCLQESTTVVALLFYFIFFYFILGTCFLEHYSVIVAVTHFKVYSFLPSILSFDVETCAF